MILDHRRIRRIGHIEHHGAIEARRDFVRMTVSQEEASRTYGALIGHAIVRVSDDGHLTEHEQNEREAGSEAYRRHAFSESQRLRALHDGQTAAL